MNGATLEELKSPETNFARAVKLSPMIRFFPRALSPLCLVLALGSGCAHAQEVAPAADNALVPLTVTPLREVPVEATRRVQLSDTAINELSGLAASRKYPGLLWGHNDSGDVARIFAINPKGDTVATVNFEGLDARDWEDMTAAGQYLYIGDIGDNASVNENIKVYRLREPDFNPDKLNQEITLKPQGWETMTLNYPDGAHNAEALAATPDGRLLIVSKSNKESNFYQLKRAWSDGQIATLEKIFDKVQIGETGLLTKLVTGGEMSPDGRELAIVTYAQVYQYDMAKAYDFSSLQLNSPRKRSLPPLVQCESLCYSADGLSLWVSSEGKRAPLYEMPTIEVRR